MLTAGQIVELAIEKPAAGGRMIARHEGQVVFVLGAIPGERVRARIQELSQEGRELAATLREQRLVELDFHRATGATAVAFETWDLRVMTAGTEQVVAESLAQQNRIVYSLSRDRGQWWVLSRLLASSSETP